MQMKIVCNIFMVLAFVTMGVDSQLLPQSSTNAHVFDPPDFYRFVVQYSLSVCTAVPCPQTTRANLPTRFSIHGLWEGMNNGSEVPIKSTEKFNEEKLRSLRGRLDNNWFDAMKFDKPNLYPTFWEHEWAEHGCRTGMHFIDYFTTTATTTYEKFRGEFEDLARRNNYHPGKVFNLHGFTNSFTAVPWARCYKLKNGTFLVRELRFRVDPITGDFTPHPNDDTDMSCPRRNRNALGLLPSTARIKM